MSFSPNEIDKITSLLMSVYDSNKLLACQLIAAKPKEVFKLKRILCVAAYLDKNFREEVEGEIQDLLQKNIPASALYQIQNEIIILDYARYKFKIEAGWHTPNSLLRKYLTLHQKFIKHYLPIFAYNAARFAQYYRVLAGRIQEEMQSHKVALYFYKIALELYPQHDGAKLDIAKIWHQFYLKQGKKLELYPQTIQYYLEGHSSPEQMFSYIQAALLCIDMGDFDESQKIYKEALTINPEDSILLNNYANLLFKEFDDFEQAKELINRGLAIQIDAYLLDTLAYIEMEGFQNMAAAKDLFDRALALDGSNHWSQTGLGDWYFIQKNYPKALWYYQKGLHDGLQFRTRDKRELIKKLEKITTLYKLHYPHLPKGKKYQSKLEKLSQKPFSLKKDT